MKKAIIYARQSSGSESSSESIEVQIRNCSALAEKMNIEVTDILYDYNVSGKTYPAGFETIANQDQAFLNWFAAQTGHKKFRSGLGNLLNKLTDTDCIIVDEITRLYRPLSNSFLESFINQKLITNNVRIVQVKGGMLDLALFDQHLITMLKNQINDEQIAKQRQKSIEVMNKIRDNGFLPTGPKAWGLDYDKTTKKISMSAEKSELVSFIFNSISQNIPYNQIVLTVNETYSHFFKKNFWMSLFYNIAKNPIYCGYQFNSNGELIKNKQWDGIISYELFESVQKIMQKKRIFENKHHQTTKKDRFLPLSGYIFCRNCGSRLIAGVSRNKVYYRCPNSYMKKNTACSKIRIAESVNNRFTAGLKEITYYFFQFFWEEKYSEPSKSNIHSNNLYIHKKTEEFSKKKEIFTNAFINGTLPLSEYNKNMQMLSKNISIIKKSDTTLNNSISDDGLRNKYHRKKLNHEEYLYLLKNTLNKITVCQDTVIFDTKFGIYEHKRKIFKRQKGIAKYKKCILL